MPRLIIETGSEAGMVYSIKEEAVTIGRSASSTIQVVDKRVSRHHTVLRRNRDSFVVEDLGSKNGTFLNDEPLIGRVKLNFGDRVQVGDTVLLFERATGELSSEVGDSTRSGAVKLVEEPLEPKEQTALDVADRGRGMDIISSVTRDALHDPLTRLRVLYQVGELIRAGEQDTYALLSRAMDIIWNTVTPFRGIILLKDERDGELEPVVVRTRNGSTSEISVSRGIVERAMNDQVAVLVSDAPSDLRFASNDSVVTGRIRSAICAPMVHKEQVFGVIYIDSQEPGSVYYTNDELELITGIGNQLAIAIVNSRLQKEAIERQKMEKELEIARTIQMNLLPKEYPVLEGVKFAAMSQPARQVGGDYYDFVTLSENRVAIVVADVSGKGVPAAILTATIRASLRIESTDCGPPDGKPVHDIVSAINRWTCRDATNNMFVTMIYVVFDAETRRLTYTNAGHCFPLLFKPDGEYTNLETGGCFLGIMDLMEYSSEDVQIEAGDTLILYTDGVTDAHNSDHQVFGTERMIDVIRRNLDAPAEELRDEIYEATLMFRGPQEQFDDLTIMVVKF